MTAAAHINTTSGLRQDTTKTEEPEIVKPASLLNCQLRPMTEQEASYLLKATMSTKLEGEADQEFADQLGFAGKVFYGRCRAHEVKIEKGLMLFLLTISNSPGKCVMWVWTLHCMKHSGSVDLLTWATHFATGVPTDEAYSKVWDSQKARNGQNRLDHADTWKL